MINHGKSIILVLALLWTCRCQQLGNKVKLDKNIVTVLNKIEKSNGVIFSLPVSVGVDESENEKGVYQELVVDLGFNDVYIPDGKNGPFGMECLEKNGCFVQDSSKDCPYGRPKDSSAVSCSPANAFLRFSNSTLKDKNVVKLPFKLIKGDDKYIEKYSKHGVLGLSPKSPFWNYLLTAFDKSNGQDYFDISFYYNIENQKYAYNISESDYSSSHAVINGRYTTTDSAVIKVDDGPLSVKDYWQVNGVTVKLLDRPEQVKDLCIDNSTLNAYLFTKDYQAVQKSISQKLCGKDSGCVKSNSKVRNLDNSLFTFTGSDNIKVTIQVSGSDLIGWASDDSVIIGIKDISDSPACSLSDIALGPLFFTLAELSIRVRDGPKFEVGLSKNNSPDAWIYLICFIILIAMLVFVGLSTALARSLLRKYKIIDDSNIPTTADQYDHQKLTNGDDINEQ